jgi:hypothetical protein
MNVIAAIPTIIEIVKVVEKLLPENSRGAEKLAAVRAMVEQAFGDVTAVWPQIESVVSLFVKLANLSGLFKKG